MGRVGFFFLSFFLSFFLLDLDRDALMMAAQWPPVNVQAYTGLPHQQSPRHSRLPDTLGQRPAHPENTPSAVPCSPSVTQKHTHIHIVSPSVNNSLLLIYQCWSIEIHGHTYRQPVGRQPFTADLSVLVHRNTWTYISSVRRSTTVHC